MSKSREQEKQERRQQRQQLERQHGTAPLFKEGEIPRLSDMPPHLTLNEVYGWKPCTPDERWSGLTMRLCELRETPFAKIDSEDVCFLLRHQVGVEVFLEQALAWLEQDPLADMQYYHGDLLIAVLDLDAKHLMAAGRAARLIAIAERALTDPRTTDALEFPRFEETWAKIEASLDRLRQALRDGGVK